MPICGPWPFTKISTTCLAQYDLQTINRACERAWTESTVTGSSNWVATRCLATPCSSTPSAQEPKLLTVRASSR